MRARGGMRWAFREFLTVEERARLVFVRALYCAAGRERERRFIMTDGW